MIFSLLARIRINGETTKLKTSFLHLCPLSHFLIPFISFLPSLISFLSSFYFFSGFLLSPFFLLAVLIMGLISGKVLVDYRIKCSLTLLKSPFIDVEPRFSVYEWRFIDVERTFNVYERRFYLSINVSFLS